MYIAVFCHPQADWKPAWTNVRNDISCWQQTTCETDVPQNLAIFHLEAPQNFPSLARSCHTRKNIPIPLASVTSNGTLCLNLALSRVSVFAAFIKHRTMIHCPSIAPSTGTFPSSSETSTPQTTLQSGISNKQQCPKFHQHSCKAPPIPNLYAKGEDSGEIHNAWGDCGGVDFKSNKGRHLCQFKSTLNLCFAMGTKMGCVKDAGAGCFQLQRLFLCTDSVIKSTRKASSTGTFLSPSDFSSSGGVPIWNL